MISLDQYGITLKRITEEDIELIRNKRNTPAIRARMSYRKKISSAEQKLWFQSINNQLNYYFLIKIDFKPIGVINCKEVNIVDQYGEGGIFIWDENYVGTPYPTFASLILLDFIFNELCIGNLSFARILSSNSGAQRYNKMLGYVKMPRQENIDNQWYVLTKETFNKKSILLKKAAKAFSKSEGKLIVRGGICKENLNELNAYLEQNASSN